MAIAILTKICIQAVYTLFFKRKHQRTHCKTFETHISYLVLSERRYIFEAIISQRYKPFRIMRLCSGEPEYDLLLVRTSLLVSAPGLTFTNGRQEKNCLNPRRNLKKEERIMLQLYSKKL